MIQPYAEQCYACSEPLKQEKTGRPRQYCDEACKQRYYRRQKRLEEGRPRRQRKPKPISPYQRQHPTLHEGPKVVVRLGERDAIYECGMCGIHYRVDRRGKGGVLQQYCSDKCTRRAREAFLKLGDAYEIARAMGMRNSRIELRMDEGLLSPLCAHCGIPFEYRIGRGRKRKYCTDRCRKAAYEKQYVARYRRKRQHRYRACPNCGTTVDRVNGHGRLQRVFCGDLCKDAYGHRRRVRERQGNSEGYREYSPGLQKRQNKRN